MLDFRDTVSGCLWVDDFIHAIVFRVNLLMTTQILVYGILHAVDDGWNIE